MMKKSQDQTRHEAFAEKLRSAMGRRRNTPKGSDSSGQPEELDLEQLLQDLFGDEDNL